ncbi:probable ATP-dependent RNA helicase DHX37 [Haliotis rubra]|uniref:probable ATP-dependent RNA helicase DHX37 n=1 Tax=Haliotis rubra TaxID=36100 RepID=UPI001EE6026A|nr:probable ATP-dependent RNA helicase DHX37 [Haliotis rubra]
MGKSKRKFNWKARQQSNIVVDHSEQKKIKLDLTSDKAEKVSVREEDSNVLVLPGKKRSTKKKNDNTPRVKKLSKKERKRLQRVIEVKEKKSKRAELLQSLKDAQASSQEAKLFSGIAEVYTQKFKNDVNIETTPQGKVKLNTISGSGKKTKQKKCLVEEEELSGNESVSSVDTSDISTDEEWELEEEETANGEEDSGNGSDKEGVESVVEKNVGGKAAGETKQCVGPEGKKDPPVKTDQQRRPAVHVLLSRRPEVQEARLKLPILSEEQVVMEAINEHPVVIICGETGSGKTTQVPQFLYEAGYAHGRGIIGVTEPRRVAAISMSKRVAMEMNLTSREVSYQIRYEGNVTDDTVIKFQTDGVLLKEVQKDFLLSKYSVIIVDEAHERSVFTDILIGLLSRIVPLREKRGNPLKLIIMSATLRVEDFTENKRLFKVTPPVIKVESRQFPVTIHFNKRTPLDDYLADAYRKVCKIHRQLPSGGILVFVTGQQEVHTLCKKLRNTFPYAAGEAVQKKPTKAELRKQKKENKKTKEKVNLPKVNLDNYSVVPEDEEVEYGEPDSEEEVRLDDVEDLSDQEADAGSSPDPMYVLPLYSLLSSDKQVKVFDPPPEGCRLCVVATNVAETSLTIPNIKYVVDTGKVKTKFYDKVTGVSTFRVTWTSKAAANQRAGRAGRVGAGHCYRLYSSAVFNDDFEKFAPPEISRRPVDDLILQMKDMNIDRVANFPFPTSPDVEQIKAGEKLLMTLGALTPPQKPKSYRDKDKDTPSKITPVGRAMACFPVSPRYGKMLSLGHQHNLLPYVIAIVSALSVDEVFMEIQPASSTDTEKEDMKQRLSRTMQIKKMWAGQGNSMLLGDLMILLKAVGSCEYEGFSQDFCHKFGIRFKAMKEIRKLRAQLTNTVNGVIPEADLCVDPKLIPPNDLQAKLLRQIVLSGLADHVARRAPAPPPGATEDEKKLKHAYYFHPCVACAAMLPPQDSHDVCLRCLAVEHHDDQSCENCQIFSPKTTKRRSADFLFYTNLLQAGGDLWAQDPPSKVAKSKKSSSSSSGGGGSSLGPRHPGSTSSLGSVGPGAFGSYGSPIFVCGTDFRGSRGLTLDTEFAVGERRRKPWMTTGHETPGKVPSLVRPARKLVDQEGVDDDGRRPRACRQLTEVHSHLARRRHSVAALSQMMSAVMGLRRLWLSVARYSPLHSRRYCLCRSGWAQPCSRALTVVRRPLEAWKRGPPPFSGIRCTPVPNSQEKADVLRAEVQALLDKAAIEVVPRGQENLGVYSTYFLVTKKDGGFRPILNLKGLNSLLESGFILTSGGGPTPESSQGSRIREPSPDAFQLDWTDRVLWALPPIPLIPRVLSQLATQPARLLVLLAPLWSPQRWFPVILRSLVQPPCCYRCDRPPIPGRPATPGSMDPVGGLATVRSIVAVECEWLPVFAPSYCVFSKPQDDPPPCYKAQTGEVFCHMTSSYGRANWPVPAVPLSYPAGLDRYKWFARFLLEGQVVPQMKQFVPTLLSTPSTMVKSWARLQPRTETLLSALVEEGVDCLSALTTVWRSKPNYLLEAYLEWLPEALHGKVKLKWPPLQT